MTPVPDLCPLCGADLTGEPILEVLRLLYGGQTHFSRANAIFDGGPTHLVAYLCPDCNGTWPVEGQ